jgi:hypothetical protein
MSNPNANEDLIVNTLFETLSDSQRSALLDKVIQDEMLPNKLRDPDANYAARGFWILMIRSKSEHNWASLDDIIKTLVLNDVTKEEASITQYVISKYITSL